MNGSGLNIGRSRCAKRQYPTLSASVWSPLSGLIGSEVLIEAKVREYQKACEEISFSSGSVHMPG